MKGTFTRRLNLTAFFAILVCCSQIAAAPYRTPQSSTPPPQSSNSSTPTSQSGSSQSGSSQSGSSQSGSSGATADQSDDKSAAKQDDKSADKSSDKGKKDSKDPDDQPQSRLKISVISAETSKPVGNASVYIRYAEGHTFLTHKEKQAEMNFKTNQDGTVKVPDVPRGKTLIQVVAPGWHTYGDYYDIEKEEEVIEIKLKRPPKWY